MIEKLSVTNKRNERLSCVLNNGKPTSPLLIFVHGFAGNKEENGLFIDAERFFSERKYNVLRFDMGGAGESEGDYMITTLDAQVKDIAAVINCLGNKYPSKKFGIVGFSLGATAALIEQNPRITAYALWSPALFPAKDMFPRYNTDEIRCELQERGYIEKGNLKVGPVIISDLQKCRLEGIMQRVSKPVLLVHGTEDSRINYQSSKIGKKYFPNAELVLVSGANHSFKGDSQHRRELFEKTYEWFEKTLG